MADFSSPRQETEEIYDFDVLVSKFENGAEQRRLRHTKALIGFKIKTPVRTYAQYTTLRSFYTGKQGGFTSFTYLNPFDNTEYAVRFEPGSFRSTLREGVYQVEYSLTRVI